MALFCTTSAMDKVKQILHHFIILTVLLCAAISSTRNEFESFPWDMFQERMYNAGDTPYGTSKFLKEYDFIVIGAGSAGCVMANRLTEVMGWSVLVLEAGGDANLVSDIPVLASYLSGTDYDWKHGTEPAGSYCLAVEGRRCLWHHGKAVGGSRVINYMVYSRGNRRDYDKWESLGNPGWGYKDVLPYFLKSEDVGIPELMNSPYHSSGGLLSVQHARWRSPLSALFLEAAQQVGYPLRDPNGQQQIGFSYVQATLRNGSRHSAAKAFLKPIRFRPNLHIAKQALVIKVVIDDISRQASGVEFIKNGRTYVVKARKEVILSAGTINSPQLLMLSGVGPREHLEDLGIPVVQDLRVGFNLQDHVGLGGLTFLVNDTVTLVERRMVLNLSIGLDYLINRSGPLTIPGGAEVLGFIQTQPKSAGDEDVPDVELVIGPGSLCGDSGGSLRRGLGLRPDFYRRVYGAVEDSDAWSAVPILLHPRSRGRVMLRSRDARQPPVVRPNYFQHPEDLETLVEGIKAAVTLSETPALQRYASAVHSVPYPGCELLPFGSPQYWGCAARQLTLTLQHQAGTCKMGPDSDPEAVVDPELRVRGVGRLRVVDASIMPVLPAGHTMAPVYMIAEKAADMVKSSWAKTTT